MIITAVVVDGRNQAEVARSCDGEVASELRSRRPGYAPPVGSTSRSWSVLWSSARHPWVRVRVRPWRPARGPHPAVVDYSRERDGSAAVVSFHLGIDQHFENEGWASLSKEGVALQARASRLQQLFAVA